jgi:hypothetical protein
MMKMTDRIQAFATGITFCARGLGVRMCFSTFRAGVKIDWNTSKRLKTGSIIALSPTSDKFQKDITIAIVGARPMELLNESESTECSTTDPVLTKRRPSQDRCFLPTSRGNHFRSGRGIPNSGGDIILLRGTATQHARPTTHDQREHPPPGVRRLTRV